MKNLRSKAHRAFITALREARQHAGMTQQDLADRLKRPQSFVSMYESGDRRVDVVEFVQIAEVLKADPCAILRRIK